MSETVLVGKENEMSRISRNIWEGHLSEVPHHCKKRLAFMSEDHHRVRYFVVEALAKTGAPIRPEVISGKLNIPSERLNDILDELERNLFFLVRNEHGDISWAFPVTADNTPHRLTFGTGEKLYAA